MPWASTEPRIGMQLHGSIMNTEPTTPTTFHHIASAIRGLSISISFAALVLSGCAQDDTDVDAAPGDSTNTSSAHDTRPSDTPTADTGGGDSDTESSAGDATSATDADSEGGHHFDPPGFLTTEEMPEGLPVHLEDPLVDSVVERDWCDFAYVFESINVGVVRNIDFARPETDQCPDGFVARTGQYVDIRLDDTSSLAGSAQSSFFWLTGPPLSAYKMESDDGSTYELRWWVTLSFAPYSWNFGVPQIGTRLLWMSSTVREGIGLTGALLAIVRPDGTLQWPYHDPAGYRLVRYPTTLDDIPAALAACATETPSDFAVTLRDVTLGAVTDADRWIDDPCVEVGP